MNSTRSESGPGVNTHLTTLKRTGKLLFLANLSILWVFPITSNVAVAQNAEVGVLEEVIVTARRREEPLRDLSTSISVLSGDDIVAGNINDITAYFIKTPNVSITELQDRDNNEIAMRGITNSGDGVPGSSFAFYVDEFNMAPFSNNPQLNDVAQIEILRGPQGTYFGRNAAGGAINVSTNKPQPEFSGNVGLGYSRFATLNLTGMVNVPLSENAFLRATATQHESDGYMINVNPNGGGAAESYLNGRLALRVVPTDQLTIDVTAIHASNELDSRFVVPTHQIPPGEIFVAGLGGVAITDGLDPYPLETRRFNEDTPSPSNREYSVVFGRVEYVGDNFMMTNVTGFGESMTLLGGRIDSTGTVVGGGSDQTSLDIIRMTENRDLEEWSTELRFSSVGDNRVDWAFGGIYSEGATDYHITVQTGPDVNRIILPAPGGITLINDRNNLADSSTWALYGEVDFHVNDLLTLTYGGRYNVDTISFMQTVGGRVTAPFSEGDYSKYVSRFAATYDISDEYSLYAVASQGFKAGAAATAQTTTGLSPVKPETLWNYELGVRGNILNNRARFALSGFYIDWTDLQVSTRVVSVDPDTGAAIVTVGIQNAAEASSRGIEFELQAVPTDLLGLDLSLGWLDTTYDRFPDAALTGLPNSVDLSGQRALQAPALTANLGVQFDFDVRNAPAYVRAEWSFVDDKLEDLLVYAPPADVPKAPSVGVDYYHVPSYDVINLRAGVAFGRVTWDAYVENLQDDNFYTGTYSGLFTSGIGAKVHHRTYGVRFQAEFGD